MKQLLPGFACILVSQFVFTIFHAQQLPVTQYSSKDGIPGTGATSIFQDKHGWIWIVNGYEVIRYDGHRFKIYPPAEKTKINYVFKLIEVEDEIWVLGYPKLLKVSGDSLVYIDSIDPSLKFQHSVVHRGKTYLLEQRGLYEYHSGTLQVICRDSIIYTASNATLVPYGDSLLLTYDRRGGMVIFDPYRRSFSILPMQVTDIHRDAGNKIYLLVKGKEFYQLKNIHRITTGFRVTTELYYVLPGKDISLNRFIIDHENNFWSSENLKRLVRISPSKQLSSYTENEGLPSLVFLGLFVDRENSLWIAFNGGICKINGALWERFTRNEGLYLNHVSFITNDSSYIFFGTRDGVNIYRDEQMWKIKQFGKPFICNVLFSDNKKLWYARDSVIYTGVLSLHNSTVTSEKKMTKLRSRPQDFKKDSKGTVFIATNGGLFAWYRDRLQNPIPDSLHFREIFIDSRDHLWLGQHGGPLDHYSIIYDKGLVTVKKIETIITLPAMPPIELIRTISEDSLGNILTGTRYNGLFHLTVKNGRVKSIKHFDVKNGLSSNSVWGLATAGDGKIWITTAAGLNSLSGKDGEWEITDEGRQRQVYTSTDILYDQSRGRIWVNSHPGIIYFDGGKKIQSCPFSVSVAVKSPGSKHFTGEHAGSRYSYRQNNFIFEFSANSYINEKAIQYTYRLSKNGNGEWSSPSIMHSVNFSSLSPGKYVFQVKALNANNDWSLNETAYVFEILPPFWQRAWFIVLVILALGGSFYTLYRYRLRRMREMFEMRHIIARDLHDEIGSTLTSINILSKVSHGNLEKDQQKASTLMQKVIDQSQEIQQSMSDIVWAIKPDNDKMGNMIARMREYLSHSLESGNIAIEFVADEKVMTESLDMRQRRDFFLIFKEAVNNIAKYSQCSQTNIQVERLSGNIRLMIQDNGIGFDINQITTSSGIKNMQKRASLMKGSILIKSETGKGTRIELLVPATY